MKSGLSQPETRTTEAHEITVPAGESHRLLDDATVGLALRLVDTTGIVLQLERWALDARRGPGGRPERFSKRALLVALAVCVLTDQPPLLKRVRDVMFRQLSPAWRAELGIPDPPAGADARWWDAAYRCVRTRFAAILNLMDHSPLPKSRRLDDASFEARAQTSRAAHTDAEWDQRRDTLEWFINQVIEASLSTLSRDSWKLWKGSIGVDATLVRSYARGDKGSEWSRRRGHKPQIEIHSVDPDAGWYVRHHDDRDDDDPRGRGGPDKPEYGYEATLAISGPYGGDGGDLAFPSLCMGMAVLHPPGEDPGRNGTRALASVRGRGHPAGLLAADRAYSSAKAEDFQLPLRSLGYRFAFDYKKDQLGIKDSWQGFVQVEGEWYCPMLPQALIDATIDFRAKRIDKATYHARIAERRNYRARRKTRPDAEGYQRLQCPAAGTSPTVRCELKPRSVRTQTQGRHRVVLSGAIRSLPPVCCASESVTIPPEAGAKFAQDLPFGSPEWRAAYSVVRSANEGFSGYVKETPHEALGNAGRRRVHGVAAQSVLVAFSIMAANVRKIRSFQERAALRAGKLGRLPRRRRTRPLGEWRPKSPKMDSRSSPDPPSSD